MALVTSNRQARVGCSQCAKILVMHTMLYRSEKSREVYVHLTASASENECLKLTFIVQRKHNQCFNSLSATTAAHHRLHPKLLLCNRLHKRERMVTTKVVGRVGAVVRSNAAVGSSWTRDSVDEMGWIAVLVEDKLRSETHQQDG